MGFSHNVEARLGRRGERVVVEAITRVQSVDLVADPATTRGLFESATADGAAVAASQADESPFAPNKTLPLDSHAATLDDLKRDYPELVEDIRREQAAELSRLQQEVERLAALEAAEQKHRVARRLLREFDLPDPEAAEPWAKTVVSRQFLESLAGGARRSGDARLGRGAGAAGADACRRRTRRIARPRRGRNREISISSTPPERSDAQEFCGSDYVKRDKTRD